MTFYYFLQNQFKDDVDEQQNLWYSQVGAYQGDLITK